jgi:hypothetical protein
VASHNKANISSVRAIDFNYQMKSSVGDSEFVDKTGRFAMDSGRVYSQDRTTGASPTTLTFVRNGDTSRQATEMPQSLRLLTVGKSVNPKLLPGTPPPWEMIGGGLGPKLDHLDPKTDGEVSAARIEVKDGVEYAVVEITNSFENKSLKATSHATLWFDSSKEYSLSRYSLVWKEVGGHELLSETETVDVAAFANSGQNFYLPTHFHVDTKMDPKLGRDKSMDYVVDQPTIHIDPDLPDSLFQLPTRPDDVVRNVDLDFELNNPEGRTILGIEDATKGLPNNDGHLPLGAIIAQSPSPSEQGISVATPSKLLGKISLFILLGLAVGVFVAAYVWGRLRRTRSRRIQV